ncbi:glycosyl transferase family 2 [Streptomyces sp. CoH27]|uniref:glycosyl transferase family 2 n=1 Tax=Streptomyces sp. CoH27 TaxID=2875763 RepID=UPI001CD5D068|nr:glycosyl transferase family 2 [Streptomyces sp. CoH27]
MLGGITGELVEEEWVDFGHNRTGTIRRARGRADYLLTLDADHVLRQDAPLPRLTATSYMLRYDTPGTQRTVSSTSCGVTWTGATRGSPTSTPARTRPTSRRTSTRWQEVYCALLESGVLRAERTDDRPGAMDALSRAWEVRPQRLEVCYELASRLRVQGRYRTAHALLARAAGRPEPDDLLFTRSWVYRWGLLFEYSITAHWVGEHAEAVRACDRLLALPDLPDGIRQQVVANRRFSAPYVTAVPRPARSKARKKGSRR